MCGIWGYIDTRARGTGEKEARILRDLCVAGTMRGWDGTGIFYKEENKKAGLFYHKEAVTGASLMDKHSWELTVEKCRFVVGHNRAATIGKLDKDHTHPFAHENAIGVHNGTISSWRDLFPGTNARLDSDAVIEALSEALDPLDVLPKLSAGAYALVWYSHIDDTLHFARNDERPMTFVRTVNGLFFASELKMLEWCIDRHDIRMLESWEMDQHAHLTLPLDGREGKLELYKPDYSGRRSAWDTYSTISYSSAAAWDSATADWWDRHDYGIPAEKMTNIRDDAKAVSFSMRTYDVTPSRGLTYAMEGRIVDAVRHALGAPAFSQSLYSDLNLFGDAAIQSAGDVKLVGAGPRAPMYVVSIDERVAYGYVEVEGRMQAAITRIYHRGILEQVKVLLDNDIVARLDCPMLDTVKVFSTGTLALVMTDVISETHTEVRGTNINLKDSDGAQLTWDFYSTSDFALEIDGDIDTEWQEGWKEVA